MRKRKPQFYVCAVPREGVNVCLVKPYACPNCGGEKCEFKGFTLKQTEALIAALEKALQKAKKGKK